MNIDLNLIPTTFDMLHAGLAASSVLLLIVAIARKGKVTEKIVEKPVEKIVTVEKPVEKIIEVEKLVEVEKSWNESLKWNPNSRPPQPIQHCNFSRCCKRSSPD